MIKRVTALFIILNCSLAYAQTIKTDVLVIGGTPSGVAAAIQCARSKVKTLLIEQGPQLCPGMAGTAMVTLQAGRNLPSGIWGEFRSRVIMHYKKTTGYDTTYNAPLQFEPGIGASILTEIADPVKKLGIKLNTTLVSLRKEDNGWEVTIMEDGKTRLVKTRVIIDATPAGIVVQKAGLSVKPFDERTNTMGSDQYRTSIATGDGFPGQYNNTIPLKNNYPPFPRYCIPVKALVVPGTDNLLVTEKIFPDEDISDLPAQLTLGQGAGVTAAYCAFFKTTTASLNVRAIQGELLDFKGYMLPFADIGGDRYWRAIQQVCATGLLKGALNKSGQFVFMPDSVVTTAEIKPVLTELYTRAFLWLNRERPGEKFTIGNLLSFISEITLTDPDNLQKSIGQNWRTKYGFTSDFDMGKPITRREFAILANQYLNPFARTVDLNGRVVN